MTRRRPGSARFDRLRLRRSAAAILAAGLRAADPDRLVRGQLHVRGKRLRIGGASVDLPRGRLVLLAAGKAAAPMARAAEAVLKDRIDEAIAVAPAAAPVPRRVRLLLAGHPAPMGEGRRRRKRSSPSPAASAPRACCWCSSPAGRPRCSRPPYPASRSRRRPRSPRS